MDDKRAGEAEESSRARKKAKYSKGKAKVAQNYEVKSHEWSCFIPACKTKGVAKALLKIHLGSKNHCTFRSQLAYKDATKIKDTLYRLTLNTKKEMKDLKLSLLGAKRTITKQGLLTIQQQQYRCFYNQQVYDLQLADILIRLLEHADAKVASADKVQQKLGVALQKTYERHATMTDESLKELHETKVSKLPELRLHDAVYLMVTNLDKGGMGKAFIAVKLLAGGTFELPYVIKRMPYNPIGQQECLISTRIRAECMIRILGYCKDATSEILWLIMEYGGYTLHNVPMYPPAAGLIAILLSRAVMVFHKTHFCHLDVKPQNITWCRGSGLKLIDFGTPREIGSKTVSATTKQIMHPTWIKNTEGQPKPGQVVSAALDFWSVGATIHYYLTGRYPTSKDISTLSELPVSAHVLDFLKFTLGSTLDELTETNFASLALLNTSASTDNIVAKLDGELFYRLEFVREVYITMLQGLSMDSTILDAVQSMLQTRCLNKLQCVRMGGAAAGGGGVCVVIAKEILIVTLQQFQQNKEVYTLHTLSSLLALLESEEQEFHLIESVIEPIKQSFLLDGVVAKLNAVDSILQWFKGFRDSIEVNLDIFWELDYNAIPWSESLKMLVRLQRLPLIRNKPAKFDKILQGVLERRYQLIFETEDVVEENLAVQFITELRYITDINSSGIEKMKICAVIETYAGQLCSLLNNLILSSVKNATALQHVFLLLRETKNGMQCVTNQLRVQYTDRLLRCQPFVQTPHVFLEELVRIVIDNTYALKQAYSWKIALLDDLKHVLRGFLEVMFSDNKKGAERLSTTFARRLDVLMRKGCIIGEEIEALVVLRSCLPQIEEFVTVYPLLLAKRLTVSTTICECDERDAIHQFQLFTPSTWFVNAKLLSLEINAQFQSYCEKKNLQLICTLNILAIDESRWPFLVSDSFYIPRELQTAVQNLRSFFVDEKNQIITMCFSMCHIWIKRRKCGGGFARQSLTVQEATIAFLCGVVGTRLADIIEKAPMAKKQFDTALHKLTKKRVLTATNKTDLSGSTDRSFVLNPRFQSENGRVEVVRFDLLSVYRSK